LFGGLSFPHFFRKRSEEVVYSQRPYKLEGYPLAEFPTRAQVVIIGGGVGGCSIAYHLTLMGWHDVVVLERGELTCGSTWHSAGLVGQLRSDVNLTRMMRYSTDLYRRLKDETGQDTGWREVGGLRLASSLERLEELKRLVGLARSFGMPLELIGPREAQDLFPLMDLDGVLAAVYTPTDGVVDPSMLTRSLALGAKNRGANILQETEVVEIQVKDQHVERVITNHGAIDTEIVVNAAGMWAGEVAKMVGVNLPVVPMAHVYLITKPIDGVHSHFPTLRDPDLLVYYREEVGGLTVGGYERNPAPWGLDGIPGDFRYQLLPFDWDRMGPLMENAIRRVPVVEEAEIRHLYNGPEGFTPDGEFLLGPTEVKGFWVAAAFCAHGLAGAGGIGKVMAEWIMHGSPEWDIWRLDLRRFGPNYASQHYQVERTIETYARYYDIHYPHEERTSARPLRLSPTYHRLRELGAHFGEKNGWERPNWFRPHEKLATHGYEPTGWARHHWSPAIGHEHLGVREKAGLFDETSFNKLEVHGPGVRSFLQNLCANDIDRSVGSVIYTSMLNQRGGVECDFTVTSIAQDRFLIITGTAFGRHDLSWITIHLPEDGSVQVDDVTSSLACIGLWGPRARRILERVTRADVSNQGFPYMTARRITIGNVPVYALRVTYVGELGWEFYASMEYGQILWDTLWEAGEPEGILPVGYRAIDSLRLEKGYRYWGSDIGPDYTPLEAGLGFAVAMDKGDFIGREALLKQRSDGITQKLCCMTLTEPSIVVTGNEPLFGRESDQILGWVTSGGYGYAVAKSIAYGYLPVSHASAGTLVEIEILGERVEAMVVREPLWDSKGERVKA
jgi:glycine cleavage system T protein